MAWGGVAMSQQSVTISFSVGMSQSSLGRVVRFLQKLKREKGGRDARESWKGLGESGRRRVPEVERLQALNVVRDLRDDRVRHAGVPDEREKGVEHARARESRKRRAREAGAARGDAYQRLSVVRFGQPRPIALMSVTPVPLTRERKGSNARARERAESVGRGKRARRAATRTRG